jgi:nucleoside-diphosphate-sugar epimerase
MNKTILVLGATGNLGGKIIHFLLQKRIHVKAIVREETDIIKINSLQEKGVEILKWDGNNRNDLVDFFEGVACVVSALSGLKETIIDAQKYFLDIAVEAKVPRFIPSDFAIDFSNLVPGQNRNLDWRRDFHTYLDNAPIKATSIFNGPFMDLLTTDMPLILWKQKRILCWGNRNQIMEFTHTKNIAEFTANAALDETTPRFLRIAGDRMTCNDFVTLLTEVTGNSFKIFRPGGIGLLNAMIKMARFFRPGNTDLYPAWQGMQYMRDMMEGRIIFQEYDNGRYDDVVWTKVGDFLKTSK